MKNVLGMLKPYMSDMNLNPPLDAERCEVLMPELPEPLRELYGQFNGGEIFVPGTVIFGLTGGEDDIRFRNRPEQRGCFQIPEDYLIFAEMNFGDLLCMQREAPFEVIQWDHELDEEYLYWDNAEEWIEEEIENGRRFLEEEEE